MQSASSSSSFFSIRSSNINQQETFIPYDQLEPLEPYLNNVKLLREASNGVINASTEHDQLSVIYLLRRMRKYQRALFDVTFDNILSRFVDKFLTKSNQMSSAFYQSLFFINEIFSEYAFDFNDSWLELLYPAIEELVFSSNEQISKLAKMVIGSFAVNMKYSTSIEVLFASLIDACDNDSRTQFIYDIFEVFFTTIDKNNLMYGFDWNDIIQGLQFGNCNGNGNSNGKTYQRIHNVFYLLKRVLDIQWGEFLSSLYENNQNFVNKLINY